MLLIIAGLWLWVFVPSWFKRNEERQAKAGGSILNPAGRQDRLTSTQRIFGTVAFFAFAGVCATIFLSFSENFYLIFSAIFSAIFAFSVVISRAASKKKREVAYKDARTKSTRSFGYLSALTASDDQGLMGKNPMNTRDWEPHVLPAPKQIIGELETPALAEVVEIEVRSAKSASQVLDSSALDEILRRRRANG